MNEREERAERKAEQANPDCEQCKGTGYYMYDHNHSTVCDLCCLHDEGFWLLEENYGENNGKWCCRAGCGKMQDEIKREEFQQQLKEALND